MDKATSSRPGRRTAGRPTRLRFGWPARFSLLVVLFFAAALWFGRDFDFKTGLFPWAVAIAVLALAIPQFLLECLGKAQAPAPTDDADETGPALPPKVVNHRTAVVFGWIAGFFAAIWLLGFATGGALATLAQLRFGGREKWPVTLALTLLAWAFTYIFFERILRTPFPPGKLFMWLNLARGTD